MYERRMQTWMNDEHDEGLTWNTKMITWYHLNIDCFYIHWRMDPHFSSADILNYQYTKVCVPSMFSFSKGCKMKNLGLTSVICGWSGRMKSMLSINVWLKLVRYNMGVSVEGAEVREIIVKANTLWEVKFIKGKIYRRVSGKTAVPLGWLSSDMHMCIASSPFSSLFHLLPSVGFKPGEGTQPPPPPFGAATSCLPHPVGTPCGQQSRLLSACMAMIAPCWCVAYCWQAVNVCMCI